MKRRIESLTDKEQSWVRTQLEGAGKFVDAFSPEDADDPLTLAALDRAFAAWLETDVTDTGQINAAVNVVGVAFGQFLVKGLGLRWVIVTDEKATELAVHGLPGKGDVLVFPQNFVAKRWESRAKFFLVQSYKQIRDHVEAISRPDDLP